MKAHHVDRPPVAQERLYSLDALRTVAMLNVALVHAAMSFAVKAPAGWAALDRSRSYLFDVFIFAAVGFTVQTFFVMAGLFAALAIARRGLADFARSRLRRIGLPFALALVTLAPIMQAVGLFGSSRKAIVGADPPGFWSAAADFFTSATFFKSYSLGHLWFLWYLILLYAAALIVTPLARRAPGAPAIERWAAAILRSPARPLLLAVPTLALMLPMSWMIDTPSRLVPEPHILAYYAFFFGVGVLLARQPQLLAAETAAWRAYLLLAGAALLAALGLTVLGSGSGQWCASNGYRAALAAYALYTWLMIFGLIGLFQARASRPIGVISYLSAASFWIYLVHFPIVLLLQILVKDAPLPALLKFALVCALAALILLASYEALARRTFLGALLDGRRPSRDRSAQAPTPPTIAAEPDRVG